jgi:hypothetical protein
MFIFLLNFFKYFLIITIVRHWSPILIICLWWVFSNDIKIFRESFLPDARQNTFHILRITCLIFKIRLVKIRRCTTSTLACNYIALFNRIFSLNSSCLTFLPQAIRIFFARYSVFLSSNQWGNLTVYFLNSLNWSFFALPNRFRRHLILWF